MQHYIIAVFVLGEISNKLWSIPSTSFHCLKNVDLVLVQHLLYARRGSAIYTATTNPIA